MAAYVYISAKIRYSFPQTIFLHLIIQAFKK